jgi:hypothetical protein
MNIRWRNHELQTEADMGVRSHRLPPGDSRSGARRVVNLRNAV